MSVRVAFVALTFAAAITTPTTSSPAHVDMTAHVGHPVAWHRATTADADVLAESGLPNADRRRWESCVLNRPETIVRCGSHHWRTHW